MASDLQTQLRELCRKHKVPGASVALIDGEQAEEAVTGVTNLKTRIRTTSDTLFQIGSITKVYTATLVMQLVDAGTVELDAPVRRYVPEFRLRDEDAASSVTVRQLLTHTSGIEGDYFGHFGRGDDSVAKYVASLSDIGTVYPPGAMWSYCNTGYVLAGRLVEKVTGLTWERALREKLLAPAGLEEHVAFAEEAILHRTAAGHIAKKEGARPKVAAVWQLDRSSAPCGGTLCATARDAVGFAKIHLNEGRAEDGTQVISPAATKAMQQRHVAMPGEDRNAMGLGWIVADWSGETVLWHSGGTIGQLAYLYAVPDRRFALCVLTNSTGGGPVIDEITKKVFRERLGLETPEPPAVPSSPAPLDLSKYAGTYERLGVRLEAEIAGDRLSIAMYPSIAPEAELEPETVVTIPVDQSRFVVLDDEGKSVGYVTFLDLNAEGRPAYMFFGRVARRVG